MIGRVLLAAVVVILTLATAPPAMSHLLAPAVLEVDEFGDGRATILWRQPSLQPRGLRLVPTLPDRCSAATPVASVVVGGSIVQRWNVDCGAPLAGSRIGVDQLDRAVTPVLLVVRTAEGDMIRRVLHAGQPEVMVPTRARAVDVLREYGRLGIEHILTGLDHLLFIAGLLLLVRGVRPLVWTITAFTLGHSVSLTAATLGWVAVPLRPLEAVIALSIVFVAIEVLQRCRGRDGLAARKPWLLAMAFGFVHGLSFAAALTEAGLPAHAIPLALLSFNLGVEVGQLAFVAAVLILFAALARIGARWPAWSAPAAAYAVGTIALVWFADRTSWVLAG
ncbi:MAG: HupE/UreJ family protein [Rhodospirillales bacterium]